MADQEHEHQPRMINLRGQAYMQVADRVVWLGEVTRRGLEDAIGYAVDSEIVEMTAQLAVFRATVTIYGAGGAVIRRATGTGSETPGDFGDYIEKAETKAIGRALQFAGFGTAAAQEEEGLIVDAPRDQRGNPRQAAPRAQQQSSQNDGEPVERVPGGATMRQIRMISALLEQKGLTEDQSRSLVQEVTGKNSLREIAAREASAVIERLQTIADAAR
jgi:hypothetical protein